MQGFVFESSIMTFEYRKTDKRCPIKVRFGAVTLGKRLAV